MSDNPSENRPPLTGDEWQVVYFVRALDPERRAELVAVLILALLCGARSFHVGCRLSRE